MADQPIAYYGNPSAGGADVNTTNRLGVEVEIQGVVYKYVQYNSVATAAAFGGPAYLRSVAGGGYQVSPLASESVSGTINDVVGVFLQALTAAANQNYYTWIQIKGSLAAMPVAALTAVGDAMIGSATASTTGRVAANTAPTNKVLGWAETAVAGGTSTVYITAGG